MVALEEICDFAAAAAFPARERDVRMECAALGLEADLLTGALDLGGESGKRRLRFDAGPEGASAALLEPADADDPRLKAFGTDVRQRRGKVLGDRAIDFANEAQSQVELLVALPAEVGTIVHRIDQQVADVLGRANGNEEAVHVGAQLM